MKEQLTDQELVMEFISGNPSGIETLIYRHKSKVFSYISMYIKDNSLAEDIFQETFLKVINSLNAGKYRDTGKFLPWVMRIAHNMIIDYFRKEKQNNVLSNDSYETDLFNLRKLSDSNIEDLIVKEQIEIDVRSLLDELPDDQKEVVVLRHYSGLSFKEIADQTNVSINTALGRMRYALINIRKLMEKRNISLTLN